MKNEALSLFAGKSCGNWFIILSLILGETKESLSTEFVGIYKPTTGTKCIYINNEKGTSLPPSPHGNWEQMGRMYFDMEKQKGRTKNKIRD